ncbi:hypothetical protein F2Q69_00048030 [Brassica cretica]|uniref:Uncharacterized protein n=1 Tax=Brassica cretica TaxID=69181 RepID=A0A8S9PJR5_BRACR|nr:hypothetical protein F2Q69_00048030 [Brassica cretica]
MSETEAVGGAEKWVDDLQRTVKESMDSDLFSCTRAGSGATKPLSLFLSSKKNQTITDNVVSILGSFDSRLSALESAMRPTQIRTHAIRKAHENIDKTL